MKNFFNPSLLLIALFALTIFGCAGSKKSKIDPYVGQWDYTFPTQDGGEMDAVMTINKAETGYSGFLSSDMGSVDLEDLVIEEGKLSAKFDVQGYVLTMVGTFEGDSFTGTTTIDTYEIPMNATKRQETGE